MNDTWVEKSFKNGLFLMVLGCFWTVTGCRQPQVQTHPLAHPLPTQATMKGSVYQVQKALQTLWKEHSDDLFSNPVLPPPPYELFWKGKKHPLGITLFQNPVNENDVYVSCSGKAIRRTNVYTDPHGNALELMEDFQVHLIPQGADETLIKVTGLDPEVLLEDRYWWGGKKGKSWLMKVDPTTEEEDQILEKLKDELNSP